MTKEVLAHSLHSPATNSEELTFPNEMSGVGVEHEVSGEVSERVKLLPTLVPEAHVPHQLPTAECSWLNPHLTTD